MLNRPVLLALLLPLVQGCQSPIISGLEGPTRKPIAEPSPPCPVSADSALERGAFVKLIDNGEPVGHGGAVCIVRGSGTAH